MNQAIFNIISNEGLTYKQMMLQLAQYGESCADILDYNPELLRAKRDGIICDLNEGIAPFRPRYICVDFELFMKNGSDFLGLKPATNLLEATTNLLILYTHIPSITSYPVYLGNLDTLLNPFIDETNVDFAREVLRNFLLQIDRTQTDSFVHANIGPVASLAGELILELTEEMNLAIPNLTIKYDETLTSDDFAKKAIHCMLKTSKPSFANHEMFTKEWGNYAIASCYNGLAVGGGGFTLSRLRLATMAKKAHNIDEFLIDILPYYAGLMLEFMDQRIEFMVEQSAFFKSNFLVQEKLVNLDKFTGMFGIVGLGEAVNYLLNINNPKYGFGFNEQADMLGEAIVNRLNELLEAHTSKYCALSNNHYLLHAQVGIDSDFKDNSPGIRIPVGYEPEISEQVIHSTKLQKYFPTGCGDIYRFDQTWLKNLDALLDIIKGGMANEMRYFSGYLADSDVVRVTGYLVKKSELAKLDANKQSINQASVFGQGARNNQGALDRRVHGSNN